MFAQGKEASLSLLILLDSQTRQTNPDRALYPHNNVAVVLDNLPSASSPFARPANGRLRRTAAASPGVVGVVMGRPIPARHRSATRSPRTCRPPRSTIW